MLSVDFWAAVGGLSTFAAACLCALAGFYAGRATRARASSTEHHRLELTLADGKTVSINLAALDKEDPQKIEKAIRAVRKPVRPSNKSFAHA